MNKAKSDSIFTKSMKAPEVCIIAQTSGVLFVHIYNIKIKRENLTGACAIFAQSRINPTQAKRNKIPYRLRPCPIYVQARCSDGRCPICTNLRCLSSVKVVSFCVFRLEDLKSGYL